jgi:hypothetical protein
MGKGCFSIVLDTSSENSRGHYLQFSIDICESYERTQSPSVIFTSNQALRDWFQGRKLEFVELQFIKTEQKSDIFSELDSFLDVTAHTSARPRHLFILRGKDLNSDQFSMLRRMLSKNSDLHIEALVNVSGIISGSKEATAESLVIEKFTEIGSRVKFLAWDKRVTVVSDLRNFRFLPEPKNITPRLSIPRETVIGFYGKLSFDRGLFDFLLSVFFNPKLRYQISGYGFNRKYVYRSRNFISMRRTPVRGILSLGLNYLVQLAFLSNRVVFEQRYYKDEAEMTREMQICSAIYFSCARSPYSSGLVYQSFAAGIPVVWSPGTSAMSYTLEEIFPEGRISENALLLPNKLFRVIMAVKELKVEPIHDYQYFDEVLLQCPYVSQD